MGVSSKPNGDNDGSASERKQKMAVLKVPEQGGRWPLAPYFSHLLRSLSMHVFLNIR